MISLLDFMPHETTHATNRHMLDTPGRYLATTGEFAGHHRGLKWPSMGIFHWPPTPLRNKRAVVRVWVSTHCAPPVDDFFLAPCLNASKRPNHASLDSMRPSTAC